MTNELLGALDKRISHLLEARALLADFVKTEKLSKHRGRRNYFGNLEKKAITHTFTPTMSEKVDTGLVVARKMRRTSAIKPAKPASTKLASVTITRTIKSESKPKPSKKKAKRGKEGLAP
jgi:hypothetical protein